MTRRTDTTRRTSAKVLAAVRDIAAARVALTKARHALAAAATPLSPSVVVDGAWRPMLTTLHAARPKLRSIDGVIGSGLGFRRRGGERLLGERCIIVYVREKLSIAALRARGTARIPTRLRSASGRHIPVDVVEFGTLLRLVGPGDSLADTDADPVEMGTIGAIGTDNQSGGRIALTAMHITGLDQYPPGGDHSVVSPSVPDPAAAPIGTLLRGSMTGIDAAAIAISGEVPVTNVIPGIGPIHGWRPVTVPGDIDIPVQMLGAATGHVVHGKLLDPCAALPSEGLSSAIMVQMDVQDGDSGAGLYDNDRMLLGLLVGRSTLPGNPTVFCPITNVLAQLACNVP